MKQAELVRVLSGEADGHSPSMQHHFVLQVLKVLEGRKVLFSASQVQTTRDLSLVRSCAEKDASSLATIEGPTADEAHGWTDLFSSFKAWRSLWLEVTTAFGGHAACCQLPSRDWTAGASTQAEGPNLTDLADEATPKPVSHPSRTTSPFHQATPLLPLCVAPLCHDVVRPFLRCASSLPPSRSLSRSLPWQRSTGCCSMSIARCAA